MSAALTDTHQDGAIRAAGTMHARSEWQLIETAPRLRNVLLFAFTAIGWRMGTGSLSGDGKIWVWEGCVLQYYDVQPTHWQPLPDPPSAVIKTQGGEI